MGTDLPQGAALVWCWGLRKRLVPMIPPEALCVHQGGSVAQNQAAIPAKPTAIAPWTERSTDAGLCSTGATSSSSSGSPTDAGGEGEGTSVTTHNDNDGDGRRNGNGADNDDSPGNERAEFHARHGRGGSGWDVNDEQGLGNAGA